MSDYSLSLESLVNVVESMLGNKATKNGRIDLNNKAEVDLFTKMLGEVKRNNPNVEFNEIEVAKILGLEKSDKPQKTEETKKAETTTNVAATKPKSTQTAAPKAPANRNHVPKQVPLGHTPRRVAPPSDIKIPKEATVQSVGLAGREKVKKGNWYFSYDSDGRVYEIFRANKNGKCAEKSSYYINNSRGKFNYSEYDSNGRVTFRYFGAFDENYNTERRNVDEWYCTWEYDQNRLIREIEYDGNGKPTRLDEYKYDKDDNNKAYRTIYWESDLEKLKPGGVLPYKEPYVTSKQEIESHLWVIGG